MRVPRALAGRDGRQPGGDGSRRWMRSWSAGFGRRTLIPAV